MSDVKKTFTEREMQLMACAFQAMRNPSDINYSLMAQLAGMSNPRSASNAMATIRKKLSANMPTDSASSTPLPKTPGGGRGKKRNVDDDDEEDALKGDESPTKKGKVNGGKAKAGGKGAAKGKKGAIKKEETTEDDESDPLADGILAADQAYADSVGYC